MSRYIVTILLALALTANLLVPKQIVSYSACCYDSDGNLARHLCGCNSDSKEPAMSVRRTCCDPIITRFESITKAPIVDAPASVKYDTHSDFLAQLPQTALLEYSADHGRIVVWDTGPPHVGDTLSLHSRLNL